MSVVVLMEVGGSAVGAVGGVVGWGGRLIAACGADRGRKTHSSSGAVNDLRKGHSRPTVRAKSSGEFLVLAENRSHQMVA